MKKKPETPPPEDSLKKLAELTRRILLVPKSEVTTSRAATKNEGVPKPPKQSR